MIEDVVGAVGDVLDAVLATELMTFTSSLQADGIGDDDCAALVAWLQADYLVWRVDILERLRGVLQDDGRRH